MINKKFLTSLVFTIGISMSFNPNIINATQTNPIEQVQVKQEYNLEKIIDKEPRIEEYLPLIKKSVDKYQNIYDVDPLLVIALLKAETYNFDKSAISIAGAAGLAQIIPETAEGYGIKAYNPEYLHQAREDRRTARRYRSKFLKELKNKDKHSIDKLFGYKEDYRFYKKKSMDGFRKYKKELKKLTQGKSEKELRKIDERFIPEVAIDFSVKHIAELLKSRKGDMREAVSAYNAGLGAVRKYNGVPPYSETVKYQNKIINYYKSYKKFIEN